jgi:hypothetical protein
LKIKGGHHRFEVARKLGIPVLYVICDDNATIHELEKATTRWSFDDYLESYCRKQNINYLKVKKYRDETGIPLGCLVSMLGGHWAGSGNFRDSFKAGTFKIKDTAHVDTVASVIAAMRENKVAGCNGNLMVLAISKILFVEELNVSLLIKRIKSNSSSIKKQVTLQGYLEMLESIYNRQNKGKLPLAFLANEAAKHRNAILCARESRAI